MKSQKAQRQAEVGSGISRQYLLVYLYGIFRLIIHWKQTGVSTGRFDQKNQQNKQQNPPHQNQTKKIELKGFTLWNCVKELIEMILNIHSKLLHLILHLCAWANDHL